SRPPAGRPSCRCWPDRSWLVRGAKSATMAALGEVRRDQARVLLSVPRSVMRGQFTEVRRGVSWPRRTKDRRFAGRGRVHQCTSTRLSRRILYQWARSPPLLIRGDSLPGFWARSMASLKSGAVLGTIGYLFDQGSGVGASDAQLLERFVASRDETAFEALVVRHGRSVRA